MPANPSMEAVPAGTVITVPDFFKSFLAPQPRFPKAWETLRTDKVHPFPKSRRARELFESLAYFAATTIPDADLEDVRVFRDFLWWGFQWDDDYDEGGRYCEDKEAGIASYEEMKSVLLHGEQAIYPSDLAALFKSVCKRIHAKSTPRTWSHFQRKQGEYMKGVLDQVITSEDPEMSTVESRIEIRKKSVGAEPLYALVEFAYQLDIPDDIIDRPEIRTIERICVELIVLHNDALSWFKEFRNRDQGRMDSTYGYNNVEMLRCKLGGDLQAAMDAAGKRADDLLEELDTNEHNLPKEIQDDRQVQTYIDGCKRAVISCLWWSETNNHRYFDDPENVRKTRQVRL